MKIRRKNRLIAFLVVVAMVVTLTAGLTVAWASDTLSVYDCKVEYMENPVGIDREAPIFSWKIDKGETRGVVQTAYHITVSGDGGVVWNSEVSSDACNGIAYAGSPLESGKKYTWSVEVTDNTGAKASGGGTFGMGLLDEAAWDGAKWISSTGGTPGSGQTAGTDPKKYTVECEFELKAGSLGLMFGTDTSNFYMWQINTVQSQIKRDETNADNVTSQDVLVLRPHSWVGGGGRCLSEYVIGDSEALKALRTGSHKVRLEIDNGKVWTYLDDRKLTYDTPYGGSTSARSEDYLELPEASLNEIGGAGFRVCYTDSNLDKDSIVVDKLAICDSNGKPVYYDDFIGSNSLTYGTVEDGGLVLKPESATQGWLAWQKPADENVYSLQADVQILNQAAGLVLGAKDTSHFYMWQLNVFDYPSQGASDESKLTYLRPHVWNGNPGEYGNDTNINNVLPKAQATSQLNPVRIDVDNGVLTTYVNGVKVDERSSSQKYAIGKIGFRMAKDSNSPNPEKAAFDNIMLRDAGGRVVSFDDFEDGENYYGIGEIKGGVLEVQKTDAQEVFLRDNSNSGSQSKVPLMMKEFNTENKRIDRATVYASALGHYELNLNGAKVGDEYMAPGWTEYASRVQYQAYDVTSQVRQDGANRIGAMLAPGWYSGNISVLGANRYGDTQSLIANLVIEYDDGTTQSVVTDETWQYSMEGPILSTDMFNGEAYDANREQGDGKYGWTKQEYDASGWGTAGVMYDRAYGAKTQGKTTALTAQIGGGVSAIKEVNAQSVTEVGGKWIVDMGQNFAGILNLSLKGEAGQTATIRYGEMLNDAEQGVRGCDNPDGPGSLYTANLRSAKATDRYTFQSDNKETWEPTFTFHGFRYVEISGCEKPSTSDIKGKALASVSGETGSFTSSDGMLNQIYENSLWGQRSNFLSIPTDCPQRDERMGWGADTHVFAKTGLYNMDANMFYQKWLQDVRDGQFDDGGYGDTAPNPHGFRNDVVWAAGGVIVPYDIWQMTGDTRILADSYASMQEYMNTRSDAGLIQSCGYGDWLEPVDGTSNKQIIGTAYLAYQYSLMAQIADALGKPGDAEGYRAKFEAVKSQFNSNFVRGDGTIAGSDGGVGIQSYYVLALGVGLATEQTEPLFAQKLVERIAADGDVMSVGFVSVNKLMPVLSKYGYNDIAYMLATSTKYPSWGYSIAQGATTIWERWNSYTKENGFGPVSMNSFNHYSFGSICEWFYSGVAGIKADEENPGFRHVIIEPELDNRVQDPVTSASGSYDSVRGTVSSAWDVGADNKVTLRVNVPANTTATLLLPAALETVKEGTGLFVKDLLDADGSIQVEGVTGADYTEDAQKARIEIGSGSYTFQYEWKAPVVKTELAAALREAADQIDVYEDWTDESVQMVREAVQDGQAVYDNPDATKEEVAGAVSAITAATAALEPGSNVNLAAGKKATASSQAGTTAFAAKNLTDGKRSGGGETAWSSNDKLGQEYHDEWVKIDLGEEQEFNRLLVFPRNDPSDPAASGVGFPRDFVIKVSQDGTNWETITARTDYPAAGAYVDTRVQRFSSLRKTARYIQIDMSRINVTEASNHRAQIAEIEVYNLPAAIGKAELADLIAQAKLKDEADYTPESWAVFAQALKDAEDTYKKENATAMEIEQAYSDLQEAMENLAAPEYATSANWIWDRKTDDRGTWSAFRKTVDLSAADIEAIAGQEVDAQVAADSKYWLYVNGELAVYEGSLKRGPNLNDTYVDHVDIAPFLKEGKNVIAALVWHYGMSTSYSFRSSGQAGFYFDADINGTPVISNQSWKAINYDAYGLASQQPNYRLPETSVLFDARKEQEGWLLDTFDDSAWQNAMAFGKKGAAPWNTLVDRPIPMFSYDDYKTFDMNEVEKGEPSTVSTIRSLVDENGDPVSDYILETKYTVDSGAFGVVFGYQNSSNLNMWQIFGETQYVANPGSPMLKPHIMKNGGWTTLPTRGIDSVPHEDMFTHEYDVKLIVQNNEVKAYVDGVLLDTTTVENTKGGVGFRADRQSAEKGTVDSIKVTSLDGTETYLEENFDDDSNFDNGTAANGKLTWDGSNGERAMWAKKQTYTQYTAKLPTNFQFTPYLKVEAPAGETIGMFTDKTSVPDGPGLTAEYITKDGVQSYESLGWVNGEKLMFRIPSDVNILELGYRKSGYAATFDGSFQSDDEFLNTLWTKARDTLYVTMRDNFMDCPDRERAQWWGDAVNEMEMAFYALSPDASLLAKKGIQNVLGFVKDGVIPTVAPIGTGDYHELPAQSMAGVMSFYMYYEYTGDSSLLADAYPVSANYLLDKFNMGTDGVVEHRTGSWNWSDWGDNSDQKLISNLWYYVALDRTLKMADVLGVDAGDSTVGQLEERKASIEANFDKVFWNAGGFYRTPGVSVTDDRGNALAVYAGLASEDKYDGIRNVLMTTQYSSPYMEKYALEALYLMGFEDDALTRMKDRYKDMVESDLSTLWEFWNPTSGTQNHAWTGGPLTLMGRYAAGVAPTKPGFAEFSVRPQLGTITKIDTAVPTVKGDISVSIDAAQASKLTLSTTVPAGTKATVGVPLIGGPNATSVSCNGETIWANGADAPGASIGSVAADEKYVYFEATSDITFTAERGEIRSLRVDVDDRDNMQLFVDGVEKAMPYQYKFYAKDDEVQLRFVPKYDGEFAVTELTEQEGKLSIAPEECMSPDLTMADDYVLMGKVEYVGRENLAKGKTVKADNAMAAAGDPSWGAQNLTDGIRVSQPGKSGFTTKEYMNDPAVDPPHTVTIDLGKDSLVDSVYLYPRTDAATIDGKHPCYPQDFAIEVSSDEATWTPVVTKTGEVVPQDRRGEYTFDLQVARYIRVSTTKLGAPAADESSATGTRYRLQLAEIEVLGETRTAQEIADGITAVTPPAVGETQLQELVLPKGFSAQIASSDNEAVIGLDGTVVPPEDDTQVALTYLVTRLDGDEGTTQALNVTVPAATPVPIAITGDPQPASRKEGETADFSVTVTGTYPHYQWQKKTTGAGMDIPGATEASYTTDTLYMTDNGAQYRCMVTNKASQNASYSNPAALTVSLGLPTAKEVADSITSVVQPGADQKLLALPGVPPGFTITIDNVTNVPVDADGVITPPQAKAQGTVRFKVVRIADGSEALTGDLPVVVPARTQVAPGTTAQTVADGITGVAAPAKDSTVFVLPGVPAGFSIGIESVDPEGIIAKDGSVTPPESDTQVKMTFLVTNENDAMDPPAITQEIAVTVPAKTNVAKQTPTILTPPTAGGLTYGQTLADSALANGQAAVSGSFAWKDETVTPSTGKQACKAVFTPQDSANYNKVEVTVFVNVGKAAPDVSNLEVSGLEYGHSLQAGRFAAAVKNPYNGSAVAGVWSWQDDPATRAEDGDERTAVFTPNEAGNYEKWTGKTRLTVNAATPVVEITADPSEQLAGKEVRLTVKVKNPHDAAFTDNLPVPEIRNVTLTRGGDSYTGTYTVPADAQEGTRILFEALTPEVAGAYEEGTGRAFVKVVTQTTGKVVTVVPDGDGKIPADVLNQYKGQDVTLVVEYNGYTWSIDAKTITGNIDPAGYDLSIKMLSEPGITALTGGRELMQFSIAHEGGLPFKAVLRISIGAEHNGKTTHLYYVDEQANKLVYRTSGVAADGVAEHEFTRCSKYVISLEQLTGEGGSQNGNGTGPGSAAKTGDTTDATLWIIIAVCAVAALAGVAVYMRRRKKQGK